MLHTNTRNARPLVFSIAWLVAVLVFAAIATWLLERGARPALIMLLAVWGFVPPLFLPESNPIKRLRAARMALFEDWYAEKIATLKLTAEHAPRDIAAHAAQTLRMIVAEPLKWRRRNWKRWLKVNRRWTAAEIEMALRGGNEAVVRTQRRWMGLAMVGTAPASLALLFSKDFRSYVEGLSANQS